MSTSQRPLSLLMFPPLVAIDLPHGKHLEAFGTLKVDDQVESAGEQVLVFRMLLKIQRLR